jgi:hypothetical protein
MVVNLRRARTSPQRHRKVWALSRRTRVWHRDVEVTDRCFMVDGRRQVARCYAQDETGRKFVVAHRVATEELRGVVVRWR